MNTTHKSKERAPWFHVKPIRRIDQIFLTKVVGWGDYGKHNLFEMPVTYQLQE